MSYKKYLFTHDDCYNLSLLQCFIPSRKIYRQIKYLFNLNTNGITLNDSYNSTVVKNGSKSVVNFKCPKTLFAPYCMTNDPDIPTDKHLIGLPIDNKKIQKRGYETVNAKQPSCILFYYDGLYRKSPYTSHCSAYVSWAISYVYGVSVSPTQIGDWCHVAAEMYDVMINMTDYWEKVNAISAQQNANDGKLVISAKKIDDPDKEGYLLNGHIAIVLPCCWQMGCWLQKHKNYPTSPRIINQETFDEFVFQFGPEIIQAGGLNFQHTICANGFANYYPKESTPFELNVDAVVDFFVFKHETQLIKKCAHKIL